MLGIVVAFLAEFAKEQSPQLPIIRQMRLTSIAVVIAAAVATAALLLLRGSATILATRGDVGRAQAIVVNGVTRTYTLYVPPGFQRGSGGLGIALHGSGGSGRYMARRTGLNATADRFGFAVVSPDALGEQPRVARKAPGSEAAQAGPPIECPITDIM